MRLCITVWGRGQGGVVPPIQLLKVIRLIVVVVIIILRVSLDHGRVTDEDDAQ
jgi:hypothetical protein